MRYTFSCDKKEYRMGYFTRENFVFIVPPDPMGEEMRKIDEYLAILNQSGVGEILRESTRKGYPAGRSAYDPYRMFASILYCFAMRRSSLREMEDMCRYDVRLMTLLGLEAPSYKTISPFLSQVVAPHAMEIFAAVTKAVIRHYSLDVSDQYLDGTKIEANANKYKFVWKPTKFHARLGAKARGLLERMGYPLHGDGTPKAADVLGRLEEFRKAKGLGDGLSEPVGRGRRLTPDQRAYRTGWKMMAKLLEYEEKEAICGPDRRSYFKTDHDATAMCLKQDYYSGLGSNMHAAYNVQILVSNGIITFFDVFHDRSDYYTLIPMLEGYRRCYGRLPENLCADSGYGIYANYAYLDEHGIGNYVKYQSWQMEADGKRPRMFHSDGEHVTCLGGCEGRLLYRRSHAHSKGAVVFEFHGCAACPYEKVCRKNLKDPEPDTRLAEMNPALELKKQEARENLLGPKGIVIRVNRSIQVEGAFGDLKQNMGYMRVRRRGLPKVRTEVMMYCLGRNIRKLFSSHNGDNFKADYWKGVHPSEPEVFKFPKR